MSENDGGHAFPGFNIEGSSGEYYQVPYEGMSLRDWFAGMALQGMVATSNNYDAACTMSYAIADAMLKARGE